MTLVAPVKLPAFERRRVLGIWRMPPPIPCTRTIEQVEDKFFMVARCISPEEKEKKLPPGIDGSVGLPLARISETEYESTNTRYRILQSGRLVAYQEAEVIFECEPQSDIWP